MKSLRTARVLIVDDKPHEAMPVIKFLGGIGIGCVYVSGELEELEDFDPIQGIRLAFVDMELDIAGTSREILGKTVNVLKRVLAERTAPIMFVAWTQHDNYVEEFTTMLRETLPDLQPLIVHRLPKPFAGDGQIKSSKVVTQLTRLLRNRRPLGVLWLWEQMSHDATTATTQAIADFATSRNKSANPPVEWKTSLGEILRLLLAGGAGQNEDEVTISHGLLEVLNSLHLDCLEQEETKDYRDEIKPVRKLPRPKLLPSELASVNSMLLTALVEPNDSAVRPGNVYAAAKGFGDGCPHFHCKPDVRGLAKALLNPQKDPEYKTLLDRVNAKAAANQKGSNRRKLRSRYDKIIRQCKVVLVEVSPPCDFSQRKRSVSRFVAGLMIPAALEKLVKREEPSSRILQAIKMKETGEIWQVVLSARFFYAIGKPEKLIKSIPIFKLRSGVLGDVEAWLAAQSARPGYISLG